jgi:saxitoxin biosynthesis operon SxtJ-like protein
MQQSSNRTFGLVMAAFFGLLALLPLLRGAALPGRAPRWWAVACSVFFLCMALAAPAVLGPLNRAWTALGAALHKVTNPIILGIFFFLVFVPFGWVLRRMGKDFLRLRRAPESASYWIPREPAGPPPVSMSNQF